MKVNYAYLHQQFADVEGYFEDLRELVASGEFTLGPYMERFERKFGDYIGIKHVIGVNTGTDALILCLKALGVGAGDEVVTVPNSRRDRRRRCPSGVHRCRRTYADGSGVA
jgi:aminotransferase EvaB